jgi:hypothetical protein
VLATTLATLKFAKQVDEEGNEISPNSAGAENDHEYYEADCFVRLG